MFNTDLINLLQQFDNPIFYWFMAVISILGTIPVVLSLILGITLGIDFKKGLVLLNVIAWTAIITNTLKLQIDYPRPPDVDSSVHTDYYEATEKDLTHIQPTTFFERFSPELLNQTRNDDIKRYGFPSGHTSIQVALWMSLFFLFRKRWISMVGVSIIFLTFLSRVYLGHHFLGDVAGGFILGLTICGFLLLLIKQTKYLNSLSHHFKSLSILWLPVFLIPFTTYIPVWILASLIGINIASTLIILYKNFPVFHVILWKRVLSALIGLFLIYSLIYFNKRFTYSDNDFIELIIESAMSLVILLGAVTISYRLNLIRFRF